MPQTLYIHAHCWCFVTLWVLVYRHADTTERGLPQIAEPLIMHLLLDERCTVLTII